MTLESFFQQVRPSIETALDGALPSEDRSPPVLHQAMRYSVFAGGKRLRPALCLAGFRAFSPEWRTALPVAAAIEMIHTYSLIHDDLPAMDDDDFRRGRPSCHKRFGEATAILAGDALLTLAFETVARAGGLQPERLLRAVRMLAEAAGTIDGMIGGQVLDVQATASGIDGSALEAIHRAKTGALLAASVSIGAYLGGADAARLADVAGFGRSIGLAFQIVDDMLDETVPAEALGKTPGKDREHGKATYAAVHGMEASRRMVARLTADAMEQVRPLGSDGVLLGEFARHLERRAR